MTNHFEIMTQEEAIAFVKQYNSRQYKSHCDHTADASYKLQSGDLLVIHAVVQADGTYALQAGIISHLIL